jgi:iron complex outermembrane receptor protein
MKYLVLIIDILFIHQVSAQTANNRIDFGNDTLANVTVHAFMLNNKWKESPAAVAIINHSDIEKTAPTSLLPAINSVAGVRMEERSPGSYRLSIRGTTLRSPFGVRNVKVYWNNIPITDGGGNTYLTLIDVSQINSMEIIKGPSSSVYGTGTGGVLLMNSLPNFSNEAQDHVKAGITAGYRQQSAVRRDTYD